MKTTQLLTALLLTATTACSDSSDVYYMTSYPITRMEALADTPDEELKATIEANVLASAPVKVGGRYVLEFTEYNGGILKVYPTEDAPVIRGTFLKEPGQTDLIFSFGEVRDTCKTTFYSEEGVNKVLLNIDLTTAYKALFPDAELTKVERNEYTSHSLK